MREQRFASFREFYPFYLSEHSQRLCRRLHVLGSTAVLAIVAGAVVTRIWWLFALVPLAGYGAAWIGHFAFEHNHPATFRHPFYSLAGDWVMFVQALAGRISW